VISRSLNSSNTFAYSTAGTERRMETNPGNPSAPPIVCGIQPPYPLVWSSFCFAHDQKLSSPAFNTGGVFPYLAKHENFSSLHSPIVGASGSPVHRECLPRLGAALCNLPSLSLFDSTPIPLSAAIAPGIAIPRPHGGVLLAPFQTPMGVAGHQMRVAAPSCRLCLIACNSRQFDEHWGRA